MFSFFFLVSMIIRSISERIGGSVWVLGVRRFSHIICRMPGENLQAYGCMARIFAEESGKICRKDMRDEIPNRLLPCDGM